MKKMELGQRLVIIDRSILVAEIVFFCTGPDRPKRQPKNVGLSTRSCVHC